MLPGIQTATPPLQYHQPQNVKSGRFGKHRQRLLDVPWFVLMPSAIVISEVLRTAMCELAVPQKIQI
jgi:hypothetical protein